MRIAATSDNLKRLCTVRLIVHGAMLGALAAAYINNITLSYAAVSGVLGLLIGLNGLAWLRAQQTWPVTDIEFLAQILGDILGLGVLLYLSGGATNPFISYFLVPLSIAAATLPWRYTWLVALLCIAIYFALLLFHLPVEVFALHQHGAPRFNLHFIGMWANFSLSALLITYFVVGMAQALRDRERQLEQLRAGSLRDEQVIAVATLAAGTAHELGTPLSTMKVLLGELQAGQHPDAALGQDLRILETQLDRCRDTLKKLVLTADSKSRAQPEHYPAGNYCRQLMQDWQLLHPATQLDLDIEPALDALCITADATLKQALMNLLNNAAEASPEAIELSFCCKNESMSMTILDRGPGLAEDIAEQIGKPVIINSDSGLGIGLLLTHATLTLFGGSVTLLPRPGGGTQTLVELPVSQEASHA